MNETTIDALNDTLVLEYLREYPDLLVRFPDLLLDLEVPHRCGKAVSLVEYQLSVIKDHNRSLKRRLRELIDNARSNQDLVQRLLQLSVSLYDCDRVGDVIAKVYQALGDDFDVDVAAMRLFGKPPYEHDVSAEFVAMDEQIRALFAHVLKAGRPICGRLQSAQLEFLFGSRRQEIGSSALLPLGSHGDLGMLAMGSRDPQRFHPAQSTDFLRHVADLLTSAIIPHLAEAA